MRKLLPLICWCGAIKQPSFLLRKNSCERSFCSDWDTAARLPTGSLLVPQELLPWEQSFGHVGILWRTFWNLLPHRGHVKTWYCFFLSMLGECRLLH
jgi:hypothetical protein